jgi:hypothetical protein
MIAEDPTNSVLVGWKSTIQSNLKNTENKDVKVSYQVKVSKDGTTVWQSTENLTVLCDQTPRPITYWSPNETGNYTIQTSVLSQTNPSQIMSTNNGTIHVLENSDLQTFSNLPPVEFKILNDTTQISQQGNATFLVQAGPSSPNYRLSTINLSIVGPQGINAWFDKYSIFSPENKPENLTMFVYADSSTRHGLNTLKIGGKGYVTNLVTGEMFSIGNPILEHLGLMPLLGRMLDEQGGWQNIGTINLSVLQSGLQLPYATIGSAVYHPIQFCSTPSPQFNGMSCMGFTSYEEFPIKVYSDKNEMVTLGASNTPDAAWIKFQPAAVLATPEGTSAKMIIAGSGKPFMINPIGTDVMHINVNSKEGISTTYIPLLKSGQQIKVINSTGPIGLGSVLANINNATPNSFGIVYDSNQTDTLPVSLSVLGVMQDNKIVPLPSWLSIKFEPSSFNLNSSQPFYFKIETATFSPPTGSHSIVVVGEKVGEKNYTENLQVNIPNPIRFGGAMAMTPVPSTSGKNSISDPLKQFNNEISIDKIKCNRGLELLEKKDDHSPACVKPSTAIQLIERGWAIQPR